MASMSDRDRCWVCRLCRQDAIADPIAPKIYTLNRLRKATKQTAMKNADGAGIAALESQHCRLSNRAVARLIAGGTVEMP